jgi:hypothetical protein
LTSRNLPGRLLIPALLGALALGDLRVELVLLADHFTVTSFSAALAAHPLAVAVLALMPSLVRHYR